MKYLFLIQRISGDLRVETGVKPDDTSPIYFLVIIIVVVFIAFVNYHISKEKKEANKRK